MKELSDAEWEKKAEQLLTKVHKQILNEDEDMIIEIFACLISDMIDDLEPEEGVPMLLKFLNVILQKTYGIEGTIMKANLQ
jgi:hypothetical protein